MRTFEINRGKFVEVIELGDDSPALIVINEMEKICKDLKGLVEHSLNMDVFTPGGSNEGWAKRSLHEYYKVFGEEE
jgi:hypothetical protein